METVVQTGASQHGLACAILQNGRPIAFASRTLAAVEISYAVVEKEALAVLYALSKFDTYVFGHKVIAYSYHNRYIQFSRGRFQRPLIDSNGCSIVYKGTTSILYTDRES